MIEARGLSTRFSTPAAVLVGCGSAFLILGLAVQGHATRLDQRLHGWAVSHRGGTVGLAKLVTYGGSATAVIIGTAVIAALVIARSRQRRRVWLALLLVLTVSISVSARLAVSRLFARPRPPSADWAVTATGWAFPSGHTNAATLGAGVVAWAVCSVVRSRRAQLVVWLAAILYAGLVGWSRVWLGVHWPTDVVGGWLFAGTWLGALWLMVRLVRGRSYGEAAIGE